MITKEEQAELVAIELELERRRKFQAFKENRFQLTRAEVNEYYSEVLSEQNLEAQRWLILHDLFFLMTRACNRADMNHDWLFDRCNEVQQNPNGYLDLWAREHYKSTIITFGKSIQDILTDPDHTLIGIFSHTKAIAKGFLNQIKRELETNAYLKKMFPEVLFENPQVESPQWSLDAGIIVKRKTNPKEATVEAWGVVDNQPTSKHFTHLVYDDLVTRESVTTPEQIKKTVEALELSYNLGAKGGVRRFIGTRYHANDPYKTIMDRGTVRPRVKPATIDGKLNGEPVFLDKESLMEKRRDFGPYTFSCQMLQDPVADNQMNFKKEWLKFYDRIDFAKWNLYLIVDPASKRKTTSDYTVMLVIGLAPDKNYYLIDGIRDRLNLTKRAERVFQFHQKYPGLKPVGYEEYGAQADVEHIEYEMEVRNYRFTIKRLGGSMAKEDRIRRLVPVCEQGRLWLPKVLTFENYEGKTIDLVKTFIDEEYTPFPVSVHDDMIDCAARILDPDLDAQFPKPPPKPRAQIPSGYTSSSGTGWMGI